MRNAEADFKISFFMQMLSTFWHEKNHFCAIFGTLPPSAVVMCLATDASLTADPGSRV